jgi:ribonuclease BN (tRNA processing enzyme)
MVSCMSTLHILGAGTNYPNATRWGSAYALEFPDHVVMVDCGPAATLKLLRADLWLTDVEWLFFTHHHSDHNSDYPTLLLFRWDQTTDEPPLRIIGPPPTEELTERLIGEDGAFADDIHARIEDIASKRAHLMRGGSLPRPGPRCQARDVEPGTVVEGPDWVATCARSVHMQPLLWPLAWRFDFEGGSVCFTGDTAPRNEVTELAEGVHTLVANVGHRQEHLHEDVATCLCGTIDAAEMARDAQVGRMVLVHMNQSIASDREQARAEMAEVYGGEILFADEGLQLEI